jgi:DNA-binding CsgD family transcriptional regulator
MLILEQVGAIVLYVALTAGVVYVVIEIRERIKAATMHKTNLRLSHPTETQIIAPTAAPDEPSPSISPVAASCDVSRLSPRELQIAQMAANGLSSKEIAAHIGLSPHTVRNHLKRIYAKLGVRSRVELVHALR